MKYATFSKSVFAVTAVLIAAACANSAEVPAEQTSPTEPPAAETTKLPPATNGTTPAPAAPQACAKDKDCTDAAPADGVNCCNTKTKTCTPTKGTACTKPVETPDAGDPPPAY